MERMEVRADRDRRRRLRYSVCACPHVVLGLQSLHAALVAGIHALKPSHERIRHQDDERVGLGEYPKRRDFPATASSIAGMKPREAVWL